jgi:translation elongation factor EF-Tu-like GTPase
MDGAIWVFPADGAMPKPATHPAQPSGRRPKIVGSLNKADMVDMTN